MREQLSGRARSVVTAAFERRREPARQLGQQADQVANACHDMARRFHDGATLFVFGAGGPSTDAQHVSVEFVHPVIVGKRAFPAISLTNDAATLTGIMEREGPDEVFAHQLRQLASARDIALGIAAGESPSVMRGLETAAEMGLLTVVLVGSPGGSLASSTSVRHAILAHTDDGAVVKEILVTAYHVLWELVHVFFEQPGVLGPEVIR